MTRFPLFHAFSCSLLALASQSLGWQISGESVPAVPQEFRAAWISTVHNIDWPSRSGLSGAAQRAELLNILNTCAQLKLNAVFLQVRPNADALYRSSLEPWSQWLSGPGVNPGYDPLAFAIQEAHRRGIELHAWFNPFRAKANVKHAVGRNHISLTRPDLMKRNGSVLPPFISPTNGRKFWTRIFLKPLNGPEDRTGKRQENSGKPFWKKAMRSRPCGSSWISWEESRAWTPCSARGGWHPEIKEPQTAAAASKRYRDKSHIIHLFN